MSQCPLAHPAAIIDYVDDGVEQRLSYQFAADGVDWVRVTGGLTGDGFEQIPGAPKHMRAIRGFASLSDDDRSIAWATADAPLVHPEVTSRCSRPS